LAGAEKRQSDGVIWAAHGHGVAASRNDSRHRVGAGQYQCQWAGPEAFGQALGQIWHLAGHSWELLGTGDMHDERVIGRSPFGHKNTGDSGVVEGIGSQTVYGLSGECHQSTLANDLRGLGDSFGFWIRRLNGQYFRRYHG
jgi:hypothetical protein